MEHRSKLSDATEPQLCFEWRRKADINEHLISRPFTPIALEYQHTIARTLFDILLQILNPPVVHPTPPTALRPYHSPRQGARKKSEHFCNHEALRLRLQRLDMVRKSLTPWNMVAADQIYIASSFLSSPS